MYRPPYASHTSNEYWNFTVNTVEENGFAGEDGLLLQPAETHPFEVANSLEVNVYFCWAGFSARYLAFYHLLNQSEQMVS